MANNVTDLGKVGMTPAGSWSTSSTYEKLDVVTYEGSSYVSLVDSNINFNPSTSTGKWQLMAQHGEFTEQQLEDFKAEVVAESKEEMDSYTDEKKSALDTYEDTKETELNTYATGLKNDFDSNANSKTTDFNQNATEKTTAFNNNASSKTETFDTNASTKTTAFDDNATSKTTAFNTNATNKTTDFNDNATAKTTEFNTNASDKTDDFNDNVTAKTTAFDEHVDDKTDEFDEHTAEIQADIEELQEEVEELSQNMPWTTTEQATDIQVTDAAKYSKNRLELFGNTEQDNTKMTYKCDGTETGDYYLTYDSTDYYFTMPTIAEGDILVFDTTDLKLYLADTEITTESTGTGTNLTFISSPNPDFPQDIHVVTGENIIEVQGKNLFDKNNANIKSLNAGFTDEGTFSAATNQKHVYIKCKPNTYYVISKNFTKDWTQGIYETQVPPNVDVHGKRLYWGDFNPPVRVKTSDNANYLDVRLNTGAETTETINRILDGLQIEEGSTATDYAPYHHVYYPINLGSLELGKIGSYQDYLFKNEPNNPNYNNSLVENAWYKYKKVAKYTVTENTGLYYPSTNHVYIRTGESFIRSSVSLGSYYLFENRSSGFGNMANWHFGLEGSSVIHLKDNRFNSSSEFTDYFREHPLDIYLPYINAKNIQITDETLIAQLDEIYEHLKLVKGTNNITVTAEDLAPYMQLTYMQDLKSKLDNLDSRLALLE